MQDKSQNDGSKTTPFRGKTFMLTGTFRCQGLRISRRHIVAVIERNGGIFRQNENERGLATGTDYLILCDWNPRVKDINSSKLSDARQNGITVLSPAEFLALLQPVDREELLLHGSRPRSAA